MILDAATNATTKDLQNAFKLIGVNTFIAGILGVVATIWWLPIFLTSSAVRKQNLEEQKAKK